MDGTADDELPAQLVDLTRRLRDQLVRHAALGAWAAPGGPTARTAVADEAFADDDPISAAPVIDDDRAIESAPARLRVPGDEAMQSVRRDEVALLDVLGDLRCELQQAQQVAHTRSGPAHRIR
ncbi:MAG TPA: hypothetical protein VLM79_27360, partial [Kofleriaceae bacterium]|nr:hypothetical protein [Kofleriaceae bacterium]